MNYKCLKKFQLPTLTGHCAQCPGYSAQHAQISHIDRNKSIYFLVGLGVFERHVTSYDSHSSCEMFELHI